MKNTWPELVGKTVDQAKALLAEVRPPCYCDRRCFGDPLVPRPLRRSARHVIVTVGIVRGTLDSIHHQAPNITIPLCCRRRRRATMSRLSPSATSQRRTTGLTASGSGWARTRWSRGLLGLAKHPQDGHLQVAVPPVLQHHP